MLSAILRLGAAVLLQKMGVLPDLPARPTLTFLQAPGPDGAELAAETVRLAEALGYTARYVGPPVTPQFFHGAAYDDALVMDGTIVEDHSPLYEAAGGFLLDHMLLVSRTAVPFNFRCCREGGTPNYGRQLDNARLLGWLAPHLEELRRHRRPASERGVASVMAGIRRSIEAQEARRRAAGQVFISYRSGEYEAVRTLKRRIETGEFGSPKTVHFFDPAALSQADELMSPRQRWGLLASIDRYIAAAEEFWIYPSSDYLRSWWTLGEIVTLSYRYGTDNETNGQLPRLYLFDVEHGKPRELAAAKVLPRFSEDQRTRMARWYAYSDPDEMGPEHDELPPIVDPGSAIGMLMRLNDPVREEDFRSGLFVSCPNCARRQHADGTPTPERIRLIDLDAFLWTRLPGMINVQAAQVADGARIVCPNAECGKEAELRLKLLPERRYLWVPTVPVPGAPGTTGKLRPLDVYRLFDGRRRGVSDV